MLKNIDLLSVDIGGQEVVAILERDDGLEGGESSSVDTVNFSNRHKSRGKTGSSPGRMLIAPGVGDQVRELFSSAHAQAPHTLAVNESAEYQNLNQ